MQNLQIQSKAERFVNLLSSGKMKNHHIDRQFGKIEDYSMYQEQKDLERYKFYINSSAYDMEREVEKKMSEEFRKPFPVLIRKLGSKHD